jgi:hypothetical protein
LFIPSFCEGGGNPLARSGVSLSLNSERERAMTRKEYHQEAAKCVRLAEQTDDHTTKNVSVGLAQAWLALANIVENNADADRAKAA